MDNSTTVHYAGLYHKLAALGKSNIRQCNPQDDLTFLRVRTKKHEIMVAPGMYYSHEQANSGAAEHI